jgi:hypothetical protein
MPNHSELYRQALDRIDQERSRLTVLWQEHMEQSRLHEKLAAVCLEGVGFLEQERLQVLADEQDAQRAAIVCDGGD